MQHNNAIKQEMPNDLEVKCVLRTSEVEMWRLEINVQVLEAWHIGP
jgi:hypothetical protein